MHKYLLYTLLFLGCIFQSPITYAFSDVDIESPHIQAINTLSTLGIINGYGDNTFRPQRNINRAEFLKVALVSRNIQPDSSYADCFLDVHSEWYAPYVCYAKEQGWVKGIHEGYFVPDRSITRAEALKIILSIYEYDIPATMATMSPFDDVEPSSWYAGYVHVGQRRNIIDLQGMHFFPNNMISRASASEMLFRALMIEYTSWPVYDPEEVAYFLDTELGIPSLEHEEEGWDMSLYFEVWNDLKALHPHGMEVDNQTMYYESIKGLANALKDPYTYFLSPDETNAFFNELEGTFVGIGISYEGIEEGLQILRVIDNTPAAQGGLMSGDRIIRVDGVDLAGMYPEEASALIVGEEGTDVTLTVFRDSDTQIVITLTRAPIIIPSVEYSSVNNTTALITVHQFAEQTGPLMKKALEQVEEDGYKQLIIDIRNNGGGYLESAVELGSYILPQMTTLFYNEEYPNPKRTRYTALPGYTLDEDISIVLLTNEYTASAAEMFAASLQDNGRALIIGLPTYGKGTAQQLIPYGDNSLLRVTTSKWYTPKEKNVGDKQDGIIGILPDITMESDSADEDFITTALEALSN